MTIQHHAIFWNDVVLGAFERISLNFIDDRISGSRKSFGILGPFTYFAFLFCLPVCRREDLEELKRRMREPGPRLSWLPQEKKKERNEPFATLSSYK